MKFHHFIAPALAIAGSAYWLSSQNTTIRELTEKTRIIKERVVVVEKASSEATVSLASPKNKKQDEFNLPDGSLDWNLIAKMMAETQGNNGMPTNMKAMLRLQGKMMELTEEELVDGLEKISALDLDPRVTEMIKQSLVNQLSEKNPLAALETFDDPVTSQSSSLFWIQQQILLKVAKTDPAAAVAWLDSKIAEGKLQSSSLNQERDPRLALEGPLITQLVSSDYAAAKARMEGFTDKEKAQVLTSNNHNLKGENALNFLKLTREVLPPEQASETIANALGSQYLRSLSAISKRVADLPLSEDEKADVIENLVSNYSRNNDSENKYQEIYEWSQTEAPGQEAAIVSGALNNTGTIWHNPQSAFEEALAVSESLGNPEILTSFVTKLSENGNESIVERQMRQFKDPEIAEQYRTLAIDLLPNSTESE